MTDKARDLDVDIRLDDLTGPDIAGLLQAHLEHMASQSPPESVHALDMEALKAEDVTFWSAWVHGRLVGCVALKRLDPHHGEIKSMHVLQEARGKGLAVLLLRHVLEEAELRSYRRLSLETGSMEGFLPARALYQRFEFEVCPPFADYSEDPNSLYMTKALAGR